MDIAIESIILWPKVRAKPLRQIDFKAGSINVITGSSKRGKSALLTIIDYVLASRKCAIPVGIIRDKTEWFGLKLKIGATTLILARKEPGAHIQTGDMMMLEGAASAIPDYPEVNCGADAVRDRLSQAAGLSNLKVSYFKEGQSYESRASFRDMVAFSFQPQHIIANPYTLFYKADTVEHREKLKSVFPLALGIINNDVLGYRRELNDIEKELDQKKRELKSIQAAASVWLSEIKAHYISAQELGLIRDAKVAESDWEAQDYLLRLAKTSSLKNSLMSLPDIEGNTDIAVKELVDLERREHELAHDISILRQQLLEMQSFEATLFRYRETVDTKKQRIAGVGWFAAVVAETHHCPLCNSDTTKARDSIKKLLDISHELSANSENIEHTKDGFQADIADVQKRLREREGELRELRKERTALDSKSTASARARQTLAGIYTFLGKLEQAITNYRASQDVRGLPKEVQELEARAADLRLRLNNRTIAEKTADVSKRLTSLMHDYAKLLDIEKPDDPVELDMKNLTLRISSGKGRQDYLWEIGSGANWVGYHIAAMLALQQYFSTLDFCPVPNFLVIDQPSQVYFPAGWPDDQRTTSTDQSDIESVHKILGALSKGIQNTKGRLQIILLEHADEMTWKGVPNVNVVKRWRGGDALIPSDW